MDMHMFGKDDLSEFFDAVKHRRKSKERRIRTTFLSTFAQETKFQTRLSNHIVTQATQTHCIYSRSAYELHVFDIV